MVNCGVLFKPEMNPNTLPDRKDIARTADTFDRQCSFLIRNFDMSWPNQRKRMFSGLAVRGKHMLVSTLYRL